MAQTLRDSPSLKARIAGLMYVLSVATAVFAEFFAPGRLGLLAVLIPVSCYCAVALLLYAIFKPVNKTLAFAALVLQIVALTFESFDWQPRRIGIGMLFHGLFCIVTGFLILKSIFLPRFLGILMMFAGLVWLIYLAPQLADRLAPYNTAAGLFGEALPMLWLLVMGINAGKWLQQAEAASDPHSPSIA